MTDASGKGAASTISVELTRDELSAMLVHAQTQYAEMSRALDNLEEEQGDSPAKFGMTRSLKKQVEFMGDLALKLEGAAKDAGWR